MLPSYNPKIAEECEEKLRSYKLEISNLSFSEQVLFLISKKAAEHYPSLTDIAREFNMTPRTLQNHLKIDGVSFQSIIDNVRYEKAKILLLNSNFDLNKISHTLGFSTASNFNRAFRKWSGVSAKDYRENGSM